MEWTLAQKWKQLVEIEKAKRDQLELEVKDARNALMSQMEILKIETTTKQLRDQLARMEQESQKMNALREARLESDRRREEERRTNEMLIQQQEDQLLRRHTVQDINQLRRQENDLRQQVCYQQHLPLTSSNNDEIAFHQANALQQILDRQEVALRAMNDVNVNNNGSLQPSAVPFQQMVSQIIVEKTIYKRSCVFSFQYKTIATSFMNSKHVRLISKAIAYN